MNIHYWIGLVCVKLEVINCLINLLRFPPPPRVERTGPVGSTENRSEHQFGKYVKPCQRLNRKNPVGPADLVNPAHRGWNGFSQVFFPQNSFVFFLAQKSNAHGFLPFPHRPPHPFLRNPKHGAPLQSHSAVSLCTILLSPHLLCGSVLSSLILTSTGFESPFLFSFSQFSRSALPHLQSHPVFN